MSSRQSCGAALKNGKGLSKAVFASNVLFGQPGLPTKPVVTKLLTQLREAGILKQLQPASGRRAQVLALAELVNLCEGKRVI
jgi:hypothetical protein